MAKSVGRISMSQLFLRKALEEAPNAAKFSQCILDYLATNVSQTRVVVGESVQENRVILTSAEEDNQNAILLVHPSTCPIHRLTTIEKGLLDIEQGQSKRRVGIAASTILESSDGHVLLTRRALSLRSFPGIWVGPGGYVDHGETVQTAAVRETEEETGLRMTELQHDIRLLNLWESAFPTHRDDAEPDQLPTRHDIVFYYHVKFGLKARELMDFRISPNELDMICWIPQSVIHSIVHPVMDHSHYEDANVEWDEEKQTLVPEKIPLMDLISKDNVSAGTKFAIKRMLEEKQV